MRETRRDALKKALVAAVAAATPASLLMAAGRVSSLKLPLQDGSHLEFSDRKIFLVKSPKSRGGAPERSPVTDGEFRMKGGGTVQLEHGRIRLAPGVANSECFVQEVCCMFAQMPADVGKVSNPAPTAKFWLLKNKLGEELQFRN